MTLDERLFEVAEWEYNTLVLDMEAQGEDWSYPGGPEAWFEEVFMKEQGWKAIRDDIIEEWEEDQV